MRQLLLLVLPVLRLAAAGDPQPGDVDKPVGKGGEEQIPIIEIRGEGAPMTAAQIRALEEATDGPQDIKVKHTWQPQECPRHAKRKDFITFQYKGFLEDGKKFHQSYNNEGPIRIQLGTGMTIPGLDKGMKGMCDTELRKVNVPWRLSRKHKSKTWKYLPADEHWLVFDVEMLLVEQWSPELQFDFINEKNASAVGVTECANHVKNIHKTYGKHWHNEDIDNVEACKYWVKYFDSNGDAKIEKEEFVTRMKADLERMASINNKDKPQGRRRDPDIAWILDFNNDGVVTYEEMDNAPELMLQSPEQAAANVPPPGDAASARDEL